jgi:hypothetical protein
MFSNKRVFLDDERLMPANFDVHIKSATKAIEMIKKGEVRFISLDNDLGENQEEGKRVAQFIERAFISGEIEYLEFNYHTANPVV